MLAENGQQEGRFAFDNPYMVEDDDIGSKSKSNDVSDRLAAAEHNACILHNAY